jgi:hypothetical protein
MKKIIIIFAFILSVGLAFKGLHNPIKSVSLQTPVGVERSLASSSDMSCAELIDSIVNNYKIDRTLLKEVKALLKSYEVGDDEIKTVKSYHDALNVYYEKVRGTGPTSVAKSEKMVSFGKELRVLYTETDIGKEQIKDLDYVLGKRIMELEEYTPGEFKKVKNGQFALGKNKKLYHIDYKHYKEYVLAFEAMPQLPLYTNLDRTGGTIISRQDIREIEAHNLFPVYIDHDMKHVGYALNHERYFPMLFAAARSKNHMRYVMMGALSEGVDLFQYDEEKAICRYFAKVKKLTLEEAMMWIARASTEDLDALANKIGQKSTFDDLAKVFDAWSPPASTSYPVEGQTGVGFNQEIDDMFMAIKKSHTDPDLIERYKKRKSAPLVRSF